MRKSLEIMKTAAKEPLENEKPSMGRTIGGEAEYYYFHKRKRERYMWRCRVKSNYLLRWQF